MKKLSIATAIAFALPMVVFAQGVGNLAPIQALLVSIGNLVSLAIPIAIGLVLVFLVYVTYEFIHKPAEHRGQLIAGVVGLFVIVSIWGLVHLLQTAFLGGTPTNQIQAPRFPQN